MCVYGQKHELFMIAICQCREVCTNHCMLEGYRMNNVLATLTFTSGSLSATPLHCGIITGDG